MELLKNGVIPIVNENDVVALDELKIGDNDNMSRWLPELPTPIWLYLIGCGRLYTANPQTHPEAELISQIEEITPEVEALAGGAGSSVGTGGMFTKLQAAKNATSSGINMVIASGSEKDVIARILNGEEIGTLFASKENRLQFRNAGWRLARALWAKLLLMTAA